MRVEWYFSTIVSVRIQTLLYMTVYHEDLRINLTGLQDIRNTGGLYFWLKFNINLLIIIELNIYYFYLQLAPL